jgi:TonB family protein
LSKDAVAPDVFRDCRVERRMPRGGLVAAALWHLALFLMPWSLLPAAPKPNPAFENTELTWSGPIEDLPLLNVPKAKVKSPRKSRPDEPLPAEGADAFHPRQRIYTDPVHPTHPKQTLINSAAPPEAPKVLPELPNIVQLGSTQAPARPRIQISEQTLAKLRPRKVKRVATTDTATADAPNLEQRLAEISLASVADGPAKPKLEINAESAPRLADRTQKGEVASAPDVSAPVVGEAGAASSTLIALSATPAPPAPIVNIPQGNLAARVAISPEGKRPGVPGGTPNGPTAGGGSEAGSGLGGGKSDVGISISGGNPKPNAGASGLGSATKLTVPRLPSATRRPDPNAPVDDPPERVGPPNFATLPPDAKPEQIFSSRHVYSMNVNMPNLNSATGSWIIHFSELHHSGLAPNGATVTAPVPVRKIDPKYPQTLIQEHVEGEVILYGVIKQDGSVSAIQVVRGVDEQLDANAVSAFKEWKFEPAMKEGQAVDLEAIVHIPFRAPERQ